MIVTGERDDPWRLRFGASAAETVCGMRLMRVRDGKIVEALGCTKGA